MSADSCTSVTSLSVCHLVLEEWQVLTVFSSSFSSGTTHRIKVAHKYKGLAGFKFFSLLLQIRKIKEVFFSI